MSASKSPIGSTKPSCRRRIEEKLQKEHNTHLKLENEIEVKIEEESFERQRIEREVKEALEKELKARLQ